MKCSIRYYYCRSIFLHCVLRRSDKSLKRANLEVAQSMKTKSTQLFSYRLFFHCYNIFNIHIFFVFTLLVEMWFPH